MTKLQAELAICKILAELERATGQLVVGVNLCAIDVRCADDAGQRLQMMVDIELQRLPAHNWAAQ